MIITLTKYTFRLVLQFSLTLSLGHLFVASHISVKRWPSDKAKENCDTNLKVCCVMLLSLSYKVFKWYLLNNRFVWFCVPMWFLDLLGLLYHSTEDRKGY